MSVAQPRLREDAQPTPSFEAAPHNAEVFRAPIDLIAAEHERQFLVCGVLDRLSHNPRHGAGQREVVAVRTYLMQDFPLHIADEEADLFPLLQCRCPDGDSLDDIFALLCQEHATDCRLIADVSSDLKTLIDGRAFVDPSRFLGNLSAFAETQRRHLAWENAVILPRARAYLTPQDNDELGQRMAARRGIDLSL